MLDGCFMGLIDVHPLHLRPEFCKETYLTETGSRALCREAVDRWFPSARLSRDILLKIYDEPEPGCVEVEIRSRPAPYDESMKLSAPNHLAVIRHKNGRSVEAMWGALKDILLAEWVPNPCYVVIEGA